MDSFSNKIISLINKEINDEETSREIEKIILEKTNNFCIKHNIEINVKNNNYLKMYLDFSRSIIHNLNEESYIHNSILKELILNKKINLKYIFNYKKTSTKWKGFSQDLKILNREKIIINPDMATTDQFTCIKCKRNTKCCYFSVQTRSSDEPMTNFITCMECNYNWRE